MSKPPVASVLEPQDLLAGDHPMLDDPVEVAADQFVHSLGPHPRRHAHEPVDRHPAGNAVLQRLKAGTTHGDLGQ